VTKLWNVANLSRRFLEGYVPLPEHQGMLSPADRWILSRTQGLVHSATASFQEYEYANAKNETEQFFWTELCDNYLEMAKKRLYDVDDPRHNGARMALYITLRTVLHLFAPIMPYITDEIYRTLFAPADGAAQSIHRSRWPEVDPSLMDERAEKAGGALVAIATAVRRYKSENSLSLGSALERVHVSTEGVTMTEVLQGAQDDIASVTRAREVTIGEDGDGSLEQIWTGGREHGDIRVSLAR
jgi:valyl-tRNA synthetase